MKFLITIDTEADNQWERSEQTEVKNIAYIPRFQTLCDRYGFKPTYLASYEMAIADEFVETAGPYQQEQRAEIGAHLHPWVTPPLSPLTANDTLYHPFPHEYPYELLRQKLEVLTDTINDRFGQRPLTFRAGRYGFDGRVAKILEDLGYWADCSVTPLVSWRKNLGDPDGKGGPDFTRAPAKPYFLDYNDCTRAGDGSLLEIPVSIYFIAWPFFNQGFRRLKRVWRDPHNVILRGLYRLKYTPCWLRPHPSTQVNDFYRIYAVAQAQGVDYLEMMFHSSELMPGGSKNTKNAQAIEALYRVLDRFFAFLYQQRVESLTLSDYARQIMNTRKVV